MHHSPQRIALICFSHSLGGLELSALRLAATMREKGVETWIVAPPNSPLAERKTNAVIPLITLSPRWKYGDIFTARQLASALKEHRIDVALLMQSKDIHLAVIASTVSPSAKLVFYQQMQFGFNKRDLVHTWMYSKLSLWITLTKSMKEEVLKFTRMPREKVDVVPLGVDLTRFDPSRYKRSEARAFFGLPQKGFLIGVLGRLDRQKGQEVLLRSVSEVVERHPDAHFIIAGDETVGEPRSGNPGYKAHLENLCRTLSIERHVTFMPFIDDVPRFMAALDLVVLPSFAETYGLVVIEAMAMEKPVIATNAGGVPEIITDGKTGLLVEPRDSKALSRAILRVLDDAELGKSLARSARTEALRSYDENACVDQLLRLIAAVC